MKLQGLSDSVLKPIISKFHAMELALKQNASKSATIIAKYQLLEDLNAIEEDIRRDTQELQTLLSN